MQGQELEKAASSSAAMQRTAFAYNKILIDFIMSIKQENAELKAVLRKHYRVIDNESHDDVARMAAALRDETVRKHILSSAAPLETLDLIKGVEVLKECTLGDVRSKLRSDYPLPHLCNYTYMLFLLAMLYDDSATVAADGADTAANNVILEKVLNIISKVQGSPGADIDDDLDEILDDDIRAMLQHLYEISQLTAGGEGSAGDDMVFDNIMGSKIGKLAAEISSEIDPDQIDMSNPMDMLDFKKLADGSSPLGGIITKVGSKIQDKIKSGELSQGELLTEAMSMLKMFDKQNMIGNLMSQVTGAAASSGAADGDATGPAGGGLNMGDMLSQLQNMMGGGGGGAAMSRMQQHMQTASTRDRLRRKLNKHQDSPSSK